ncbi:hypothetical protein ACVR1G_10495 [Streptococcus dentasini]
MARNTYQTTRQEENFSRRRRRPQKKSKAGRVVLTLFFILVLLGAGGAFYRYLSGDINGDYRATSLEENIKKDASGEVGDTGIKYSDIITDVHVDVNIHNEQAKATISYKVNGEEAYNIYMAAVNAELEGASDEIKQAVMEQVPSKEDIIKTFNGTIAQGAKSSGLSFKEETGEVSGTIFKGKVNRWTRKIVISSYNKGLYQNNTDGNDNSLQSLKHFNTGDSMSYAKQSDAVTLRDRTTNIKIKEK